jgi:Family of unknown function (DUF6491)
MLTPLNKIVAGAAVAAIGVVVMLGARYTDRQDAAQWAHVAPPAQDALTQAVDLNRIAGFRYVNDTMLEVTDGSGKKYNMEFTEACPGLKDAKNFSLVTESYRDMDRFTGIGLDGRICTFKDFSPQA